MDSTRFGLLPADFASRCAPSEVDQDTSAHLHYGFTGTGLRVSPAQDRWAVLLTDRLYYTRDRQPLTDVRNAFREAAFA